MDNFNVGASASNSVSHAAGETCGIPPKQDDISLPAAAASTSSPRLVVDIGGRCESIALAELLNEVDLCNLLERFRPLASTITFHLAELPLLSEQASMNALRLIADLSGCRIFCGDDCAPTGNLLDGVLSLLPKLTDSILSGKVVSAAKQAAALTMPDMATFAANMIVRSVKKCGLQGFRVERVAREIESIVGGNRNQGFGNGVGRQLVLAALPDAPIDNTVVIPPGWTLASLGVRRSSQEEDGCVIPAPLLISKKLRDTTDGVEWLELSYRQGAVWKSRLVRRNHVASARAIVELAAYGLPINSNNAAAVVQYLADFESTNMETLPRAQVTAHMGWQGSDGADGFLWGHQLIVPESNATSINFRGRDDGDAQLASGYHSCGTLESWIRTMRLIGNYPRVQIAVYAALTAPLLAVLRSPNFAVSYAGRTSLGKTTALRIAASAYGCPDEKAPSAAISTWDATRAYIERALAAKSDLPFIQDDTKRARHTQDIAQTIYDVTSGRGRGRASLTGTQSTGTWTTVMITSGEAPLTSFSQDGGTRARVLEIWGSPFDSADANTAGLVAEVNNGVTQNYGHAGLAFVRYLIDHRDIWDGWRSEYQRAKQQFEERAGNNSAASRMAAHFAALEVAATLAHRALDLPWSYSDVVSGLWPQLTADTHEADRALVALQHALNWSQGHGHHFFTTGSHKLDVPSGGWAGRIKSGEYIGFLTHRIDEILTAAGFEPVPIRRMWLDRGWLVVTPGKTVLKTRMGGATSAWLVAIRWDIILAEMGEDNPDVQQLNVVNLARRA